MGPEAITEDDVAATPVVKLTNLIIRDGIAQGASDIHIEPGRKVGSVRYRVDGVLRKHMDLPMAALNRVISPHQDPLPAGHRRPPPAPGRQSPGRIKNLATTCACPRCRRVAPRSA